MVRCDAGISVTEGQLGISGSWELAPHLTHRICGSGKPSGACGSRLSAEKTAGEGQLGGCDLCACVPQVSNIELTLLCECGLLAAAVAQELRLLRSCPGANAGGGPSSNFGLRWLLWPCHGVLFARVTFTTVGYGD